MRKINTKIDLNSAHPDIRGDSAAVAEFLSVGIAGLLVLPLETGGDSYSSDWRITLDVPDSPGSDLAVFGTGLVPGRIAGEYVGIASGTVDSLTVSVSDEVYLDVAFLDLNVGPLWSAARSALLTDDLTAFERVVSTALAEIGDGGLSIQAADEALFIKPGWIQDAGFHLGLRGDDRLDGSDRNDVFRTGPGDDRLDGDAGADVLAGQAGNDRLTGGYGNDRLAGGAGRDELFGGNGADRLSGGIGHDELDGGAGSDVLRGGRGRDELFGGVGKDRLDGGRHADALDGGAGHDWLDGRKGDDVLLGRAGRDVLTGRGGNDALAGGAGSDELDGGRGRDLLIGGHGADVFVFAAGDGIDRITDFEVGRDRLDFGDMDVQVRDLGEGGVRVIYDGGRVDIADASMDDLAF